MQAKWFWFEQFRRGGVNSTACRRQMLDTFVGSVYVFDDRVALNFNFPVAFNLVTLGEVLDLSDAVNGKTQTAIKPIRFGCFFFAVCQNMARQQKKRGAAVG